MSRLREVEYHGVPGWQWDDGPIFVGKEPRKHAVGYGKAVQNLEDWVAYAELCQQQALAEQRLTQLKKIQQEQDK